MKAQYINGLAEGSQVDSTFVMRSRELRATRAGEAYLTIELADRSGVIAGVWFRPDASGTAIPSGTVVRVSGRTTTFRGNKRVSVQSLSPARSYEAEDMVAAGSGDRAAEVTEFRAIAATVKDPGLLRTLKAVFGDEVFFERFSACPASQANHHAPLGGLVAHSVSVAKICSMLASVYDDVDRDLLVTAALMHDIGKVDELSWDTGIEYTDAGRLIGHVVLGERRLHEAVQRLKVPVQSGLLTRLTHAMLSHHGELEWGSPKRPSTIEALLLHHADNLDAKATGFSELTTGATALDERWTDAQNLFRRPLYAPASAESERHGRAEEDFQCASVPA
ncbi:MAG: HD domain-containing protein [Actinobacteria bacterium]|nr:HD domain-containing protein [Actinomycetota bacterium]